MNSTMSAPLFTPSQWEELEHQALIFKYMMAGVPVPSDLLLSIRRGFESMASRFYHHPALSYCSFYGKKLDPEPGRCRRTDGKKWRCAKDAYPDSKYCERHMHRGRNRSRKPVENRTLPLPLPQPQQSQSPSSSSVTSLTPTGSSVGGSKGSFQSGIPLPSIGVTRTLSSCSGVNPTPLQIDHGSYSVVADRDFRYAQGAKSEENELNFFSGPSGNTKAIGLGSSSLDSAWHLMPSQVSSLPLSKERNISDMPSSYSQLQPLQDLEHDNINSLSRQQHSFFGSDFIASEPPKQENQSLRPFFDEWPKTRDPWSEIEDERGNKTSFSTTQLSI